MRRYHVTTFGCQMNAHDSERIKGMLEELGLVRHAHLSDRAPTYHSTTGHEHFHLVCRNCRRVVSVDPMVAAGLVERLREEQEFVADIGHLTVFGRCADCEGEH